MQPVPDQSEFRKFAGCYPTGVAVVTTRDGTGALHGTTMNSVTSLSLDPPQYLMCFGSESRTLTALLESKIFSINFLAATQDDISRLFASREKQKLARVKHWIGTNGTPLLEGVSAACEGHMVGMHVTGDHVVVIGVIDSLFYTDVEPLIFHRGQYRGVSIVDRCLVPVEKKR
jgi:flavin reductase (DIM6/NTAB) family NADH-FMN oxidoreductase RutF